MSINGSTASFLPFTINGLTDASFSNSNLGVATATALTLTSATPLKLARFDLDKNLVSASVDESEVAVLTSNVFDGTQTMKPGHTTNINNVFETTIVSNPPYDKSSFTTSGISGYTPPLGTLSGPVAGEYSISQTASDRSIMKLDGFIPEAGRKYVYTFTMRVIDAPEAYVSVEQGGVQRSNTIIQIGTDNETISDTFTFDPSGSTLVFKFYTGSLDPWTATWSSFSLGYYEASINAPLTISNLETTIISTETLSFPSTLVNAESWNVYTVSTMGNPSTLGGLITTNISTGSTMYFTGDVLGSPNFQFTTLGNAGKVVCTNGNSVMSTTINAGQLEYITGLTSQAGGVGQNNTWTGTNNFTTLTDVAALRITSSISNMDYSLSVNALDQLEIRNLTTGNALVTGGDSLAVPVNVNVGGAVSAAETQITGSNYLYGSGVEWRQHVPVGGDDFEIWDDAGLRQLRLSRTTGLTVSTMNITNVPSVTPTLALGVDGSGGVVSFAVPSGGGLLGSNNTWTGTNTFNNTVSVWNRLLGSTDNSPTGNFWIGLRGSGSEGDRLAIALLGDATTGAVSQITLQKPVSCASNVSITGTISASNITVSGRFIPYASATNTLVNSLFNQIDNDSMGFGYTAIPNYPLGSGGKNMYVNGSIFAGALNSMYATFGRDTNTSNPANEITFTASGAGVLLTQVKSHSGSSAFVDATWTYSNTNPTPLGANQGQVLLTADKLSLSLPSGLVLAGGDLTMSITRTLFLYYISATNHAGFITDGSGNLHAFTGTGGVANRLTITPAGDTYLSGTLYMNITRPIYLYYISATNHAGFYCEGSGDMLFFTGTGGVANRLRIASGGTATFSNALITNGNFTANASIGNINGGYSFAVSNGFMSAGSLTLGESSNNYGGGYGWSANTAGLLLECLANTEIAVHDGGDRVASFMYYAGNTFTIGRDMGWGISAVNMPGIVSITGALTVGYSRYLYPPELSGATYGSLSMKGTGRNGWAGYSIYNDANQEVDFMCQNGANNYGLYNNVVARWNFYVDGGNQGDVAILNNENSRGFRTHNALTSNVIYNATPTTASNIGTWSGFGYTLLSNTQTPAGNSPCLGFGCNYSNTGQITCLQPGIAWMNLAIFNAQTTFTYYGVACGYTVPSGGANVSDVREKHCISDVCTKNSLRKIMCLKPKYYKRKYYDEGTDDQGNEKTKVPDEVKNAMCIGVMAQDLLETPLAPTVTVAPTKSDGACDGDDGTRYGVNYGDINIHLIGAVQELKKQNDAQQKEIDELKEMVKTLMAKLS